MVGWIRPCSVAHVAATVWLALLALPVSGQVAVRNQGFVPFSNEPINYRAEVNDPVAQLQRRLDRGEATLSYEPAHGYLRDVLAQLSVPVSSQTLVFSKTSFQYRHISPKTPRALFFNDDVYVGQVQNGKVLEFVSFDPRQGAIFYILDERKSATPTFERAELDCTQCHVAAGTRGVPGVLIRSVFTNPTGTQATGAPAFITGHQSPFTQRFGGWYVTGTHGAVTHLGNSLVQNREHPEAMDRSAGANVGDLSSRFDTSAYLTPHSDIVAQVVQAHQTQMHNLITLTNYETRIALHQEAAANRGSGRLPATISDVTRQRYERPAEELVRYLLFVDEAPFEAPIRGSSGFAEEFSARGPRDLLGRSLRDFDLQARTFKYPCSYLVYSEAFDALPEPAKSYVYRRLLDILTGREQGPEFARLTAEDRQAIFEILVATKPGLPEEWTNRRVMSTRRGTIQ